jgi:ABC-type transport system involved in multi-copper enzyme maturation permease subunit
MLLGPVFHAELMTTARRARYYVIRLIYGLVILFTVYLVYQSNEWRINANGGGLRLRDMAGFAMQMFTSFAMLQAVVVLMLTPALVGGTIADERQRKTLHYLLTSQLSSAEIILSKLGARLLQAVVLVALGLPVVCLMGLFGGVDFKVVLLTYAATFTTMFFLGSASILVSVVSRRPREAISLIYILELAWLVVPSLVMNTMAYGDEPWPTIARWVNPVLQYFAMTSPIYPTSVPPMLGTRDPLTLAFWGMGLQIVYGSLFVLLAAMRLRPSARTEGSTSASSRWFKNLLRKRKWLPRKPCGDDAMLWKELHVARTGGLTKAVFVLLGVGLVGLVFYLGTEPFLKAMSEMLVNGYFSKGREQTEFSYYLRGFTVGIYVLWFFGVASSSATGLCSEREEDQWTSLTSTPLSGEEILRAKMLGPIWGLRYLAYLMFGLWALGLMVGSIHPLGLIACLIEFVVFTWFLTSLGTTFSLRSKNSTRALASTMALLIVINGGYLFCCIPFQPNNAVIFGGMTPFVIGASLFNYQDFDGLGANPNYNNKETGEIIVACVLSVLFYGCAAAGLTSSLFSMFDAVVDRPDRLRQDRTLAQQREYRKSSDKGIHWKDDLA